MSTMELDSLLCIIGGSCKNGYALIFRYVQSNRVQRVELEYRSISSSAVLISSFAALGLQFVCGTHSACLDSMLPGVQVTTGLGFSQGLLTEARTEVIVKQ